MTSQLTEGITERGLSFLKDGSVIILDGALATELEHKIGKVLDTPLWSAETLVTKPSLVKQVHLEYYLAGADIAITASYQASVRGLVEQRSVTEEAAEKIIQQSVQVANEARKDAYSQLRMVALGSSSKNTTPLPGATNAQERQLLIAGSVGPYGAYLSDGSEYTGAYLVPREEMKHFHRGRIKALVEAEIDILAIETHPNIEEIRALMELLSEEFPHTKSWISCTLRDNGEHPPSLSDGSTLRALCELVDPCKQVVAVGVNCCPKESVSPALKELKQWTSKPLVAYPNSGEIWDAKSKTWRDNAAVQKTWNEYLFEWFDTGARLIGGCCRTSPGDIRVLAEASLGVK